MTAKKKKSSKKGTQQIKLTETQSWIVGVGLFMFSLFMLAAIVSHYFCWPEDQNLVVWGQQDGNVVRAGDFNNPTGKTGAVMAHYIVGQWFGAFGVLLSIALLIISIRVITQRRSLWPRLVTITLFAMVLGSLTLGYLFATKWGVFGTGLGGEYGIVVSQWIEGYLGKIGTGLVLLLGWILLGVLVNSRRTIDVVNTVGKGIYDGGVKVTEAVINHAGDIIPHRDEQQADIADSKEVHAATETTPTETEEAFVPYSGDMTVGQTENHIVSNEVSEAQVSGSDDVFEITDTRVADRAQKEDIAPWEEQSGQDNSHDPNVVVLGAGSGAFVVGRNGGNTIHKASEIVEPQAETPQSSGGTFEVIDYGAAKTPGTGAPLSAGGVVVAQGSEEGMQVVQAGHSDAQLSGDQIEDSLYDPTRELSKYQKPPVEILEDHSVEVQVTEDEIYDNKNQIVRTLENFGIKIDKIKATIGPTVTLYEIIPAPGVKISKIKNLEDDIALSLKALGIRIIAPMPGKGTVGIEVPNKDKEIVSMYSVVRSRKFQENDYELPVVLGRTISNETFVIDLAKMPHLLVAGATGQGKSVGLNAIITSLLYKKHPAELKFVMVDPKRVELSLYSRLENHFLAKMESEEEAILTDTQKVVYTLNSLCQIMSDRYDLLRDAGVKKISEYNDKFTRRRLNPNKGHKFMPYIVVVIDEFADMIMTAGREVEAPITRLAQLARAVGIHLIIATQRPDVKVITGLIKANFPARIAFRVTSMVDSRTIIDQPGANQLIGRGDMLMSINGELTRIQCAFIDTPEIERITEFISNQKGYPGAYDLPDYQPDSEGPSKGADLSQIDPMFDEVARFIVQNQQGSTSSIQRRFSIGYNRAGRIMDQMEAAGVVGRAEGSKPREVLITDVSSLEYIISKLDA